MEAKLLLDVSEAAELCGVSRPTMYQILNRADFDAAFYIGRRRKISRAALEAWILRQTGKELTGGEQESATVC